MSVMRSLRIERLCVFVCFFVAAANAVSDSMTLQNGIIVRPYAATYYNGTYRYWGCQDTLIDSSRPVDNFGRLEVQGLSAGSPNKVLIQFRELNRAVPPGSVITNATLRLHTVPGHWTTGNEVRVYRVLKSWRQGSMSTTPQSQHWTTSWDNRLDSADPTEVKPWSIPGAAGPDTDRASTASAVLSTGNNYANDQWQVTGLANDVSSFYENHSRNFGWVFEFTDPNAAIGENLVYSSDALEQSLRPELIIEYMTDPGPPARQVDLDVTYISRTPEYNRYDATYDYQIYHDENTGVLKNPGYANTQKWPNNGDIVTFTAHVVNKGTLSASGPFTYRWLINDEVVATGSDHVGIAVGAEQTYTYNWTWDANDYLADGDLHCKSRDHRDRVITFEVVPGVGVVEQCTNNNALSDFLEAPCMGYYVEQSMYDMFNNALNQVGSYSFEDWVQWQVRVWNQSFMEMSRFEGFAEDGCLERVRIQKIQVVPDGTLCVGGNHNVNCQTDYLIDGEWGFRPDQSYVDKWSRFIEWGLIHECTHQLGMIDLYTMNMEAGTPSNPLKVQVKDGTASYISRGYYPPFGGLMGGGDTRFNASREPTGLMSGWTVGALNSNTGYRRGFYGEQVYDVPDTVRLRAIDASGAPIPFAEFKVWQSRSGATLDEALYPWQPIYEGTADATGIVTLPNVNTLEPGPFTTITGHTLKDNPWGRTNVVGSNGSLLIKITGYGQKDYTFMRVSQVNRAFWGGATNEYTHELPVQIAPASNLGSVNVAEGAGAIASGGIPAYATDGNLETRWDPGNAQVGAYLRVDLGEVHDVALVVLVQNGWAQDFFEKFSIEASLTGAFAGEQVVFARESIGWGNTVGTRRDIDPQNENIYRVTYANSPTPSRYLRIRCESAHWTKLAELQVFPDLGGVDATAPAQVTDLSVDDVAATAARLSWTTPGDDGWNGTAAALDIRYAEFEITAQNFASASPVPSIPAPLPGGSVQTYLLNGLVSGTQYWVAMRARDEVPNWSDLSNVVSFVAPVATECLHVATLATPVDTSFACGLASDGATLYYLRRDSSQFYGSSDGGQSWLPLASPNSDLGGYHGDWTSGILSFAPSLGSAGSITATQRDADNIQKVVYYDIASNHWYWSSTYPTFSHGTVVVDDYLYGIAHAVGGNYGGPINRVDLLNLANALADRTVLWPIVGDSADWFSRAAMLTSTGGRVYGIKNDWVTPTGSGDRVFSFDPADFEPSIFTGSGQSDWWDSSKWQARNTDATDLGQIPFEVGYGSAVVGLPPNWACGVGSQGGLFIVAGRSPSNHEGWGAASDQYAVFDIATGTFEVGHLPAVTGSGGAATFHDGSVFIKRGGNPDAPYNTQLWRVTPMVAPELGDLNCDSGVSIFDIDAFVLALTDAPAYSTAYPGCDSDLADCNQDGRGDGSDIGSFVTILLGQ